MYYAWFVKLVCITPRTGLFLRAIQYNEISEVRLWHSFQPVYSNWQGSPMALALGLGWQHCWGHGGAGASQPAEEKLLQDKSSVLSNRSCFHLGARQVIAALYCSCSCCCFVNGCTFVVSASSLDESRSIQRWKMEKKIKCSGTESCGWSTWDHLSWWPIPRKCFSPGVFLYTLDDGVPAVTLLRTAGGACLPLISVLSCPKTC